MTCCVPIPPTEPAQAGNSNGCPTNGCNGLVTTTMDRANKQTCQLCLGCNKKFNCVSWDG